MPKRISVNMLNASTVDIINTIRANGSYEYQQMVPEITDATEIPRVGEVLYGYPALANQFINSLVNRIALVRIKSATFNNAYTKLKKGYLEFGETIHEVFVEIAKAREFSPDKAEAREFKRTLPDVRSAFHVMNWRAQYPVTIQDDDLKMAFTSANGVQDLIAKIIDSVYTAAEYDEYLLFKYLMIKAISHGKMYPVSIGTGNMNDAAVAFRGTSNMMTFLKTQYNAEGVHTSTPKNNQYIFMDAMYNAAYDVNVLASAFNMDKADFSGKLVLVDDWTSFDNDRFEEIRKNSDMIEEITEEELALMKNVKAVLADDEWFQVYDNNIKFTDVFVSSGLYWNYNLNIWKTVSSSPFSNAIVFVADDANIAMPDSFKVKLTGKSVGETATVFTLEVDDANPVLHSTQATFVQTVDATTSGVAVHKFGAVIMPNDVGEVALVIEVGGVTYTADTNIAIVDEVGEIYTMNKG